MTRIVLISKKDEWKLVPRENFVLVDDEKSIKVEKIALS